MSATDPTAGLFHLQSGFYFGRVGDEVVIAHRHPALERDGVSVVEMVEVIRVPVHEWASVVASTTATGETSETYQAAVAFLDVAGTPSEDTPKITHGRHCPCSACAREDWTQIEAPCGMHGASCPREYQPVSSAASTEPDVVIDAGEFEAAKNDHEWSEVCEQADTYVAGTPSEDTK